MFQIKTNSSTKSTISYVKPGSYQAEIVGVIDNPKYIDGDAFIIKYNLLDHEGNMVAPFEETFFNYTRYSRTQNLVDLLNQLELKTVDELIGKVIRVEIRYRVTNSYASLPTIVSRFPLPTDVIKLEVKR